MLLIGRVDVGKKCQCFLQKTTKNAKFMWGQELFEVKNRVLMSLYQVSIKNKTTKKKLPYQVV